jgi:hypothetical protein
MLCVLSCADNCVNMGWQPHMYTIPTRRYVPREEEEQGMDAALSPDRSQDGEEEPEFLNTPNPLRYPILPAEAGPPPFPDVSTPLTSASFNPVAHVIPPYTVESATAFLTSPFSRCAWIIPVRGCPGERAGWNATSASLLVPPATHSTHTPLPYALSPLLAPLPALSAPPPAPDLHRVLTAEQRTRTWAVLAASLPSPPANVSSFADARGTLTWTAHAVRAFWKFLLRARHAQRWGLVGVSFVLAEDPPPPTPPVPDRKKQEERRLDETFRDLDTQTESQGQSQSQSQVLPSQPGSELLPLQPPYAIPSGGTGGRGGGGEDPLVAVDYIKLYLDARYAMDVRAVLNAWRYEVGLADEAVAVRQMRDALKGRTPGANGEGGGEGNEGRREANDAVERAETATGRKRKRLNSDARHGLSARGNVNGAGGAGDGASTPKDGSAGKKKTKRRLFDREDVASFRMFRGARLVLLDELNRPVLVC